MQNHQDKPTNEVQSEHKGEAGVMPSQASGHLLTTREAAKFLRVSERWLREAIKRTPDAPGSIPHHRLPGRRGGVRFFRDELIEWLEEDSPPVEVMRSWKKKSRSR